MTLFIVVGVLLVAGALLFVLPPLLRRGARSGASRDAVNVAVYRDQLRELEADVRAGTLASDQYEKAKREIEARLVADVGSGDAPAPPARRPRAAAIALGLAVPVCALAIYGVVGTPRALTPQAEAPGGPHGMSSQQFEALAERLAARMKDHPEDAEGWTMLGRSYSVLGRYPEAARAYANAADRNPQDAQLLADYADTLAMAQGRRLEGEPEKIIARALAVDPGNLKALLLAGTAAFNRNEYAGAARHWERALGAVPRESEMAQRLRASIAEARTLGGDAQVPVKPAQAASSRQVRGVVKIAPGLAAKVGPDDTLFIFARAEKGPRMPLAILRRQGRDLPAQFTLDDSMAMSPAAKISDQARVVIGARVSKTANATPSPGDLQGLSPPVKVGAQGVTVTIDTELR
ncbi:MAG: c-type cytochrome biogenesis protein CcmI [Burkholderiales bacterium]